MLRMQEDVRHRARFDDLTGVHHRDAVADAADHIHLMGDQDDGQLQFTVDLGQQLQHLGGGLRVQRAGGLVAEQDVRLGGQRPGDADALLLPTGQLRRVFACVIFQADAPEQGGDTTLDLAFRVAAGQTQRHGDIIGDRLGHQQIEVLEDHPHALAKAPQAFGIQRGDIFAVDQDATAGRFFQPVDQAQQGALAGAGVADQAEHLAGADFQPGRLQRGNIATGNPVGFMDVLEFDHGRTLWLRRSQDFRRKAGILPVWRPARSFAPCRLSECMILIGKANRRRRQPCGPRKGH